MRVCLTTKMVKSVQENAKTARNAQVNAKTVPNVQVSVKKQLEKRNVQASVKKQQMRKNAPASVVTKMQDALQNRALLPHHVVQTRSNYFC